MSGRRPHAQKVEATFGEQTITINNETIPLFSKESAHLRDAIKTCYAKQLCDEQWDFAVKIYELSHAQPPPDLAQLNKLLDEFIKENSPKQVNISNTMRDDILSKGNKLSLSDFFPAVDEVFKMLTPPDQLLSNQTNKNALISARNADITAASAEQEEERRIQLRLRIYSNVSELKAFGSQNSFQDLTQLSKTTENKLIELEKKSGQLPLDAFKQQYEAIISDHLTSLNQQKSKAQGNPQLSEAISKQIQYFNNPKTRGLSKESFDIAKARIQQTGSLFISPQPQPSAEKIQQRRPSM